MEITSTSKIVYRKINDEQPAIDLRWILRPPEGDNPPSNIPDFPAYVYFPEGEAGRRGGSCALHIWEVRLGFQCWDRTTLKAEESLQQVVAIIEAAKHWEYVENSVRVINSLKIASSTNKPVAETGSGSASVAWAKASFRFRITRTR